MTERSTHPATRQFLVGPETSDFDWRLPWRLAICGTLKVTWGDSGIGRAAGQSNLPTGAFDDIVFIIVPFDDAPDILDVVGRQPTMKYA
jgi:hypothetical protein